jgi:predicted acyltransferase
MSATAVINNPTAQKRAYALDALRGIAILMMVLSSLEPDTLPSFMHHAQVPPPNFIFNPNLPGVTWVDMVFPFFLFSLGAAIPFSMGRRIEKGAPWYGIVWSAVLRGCLLGLFAIYIEHIRVWSMVGSQLKLLSIGFAGFLIPFAVLTRLPATWKPSVRAGVKAAGWLAAIVLMMIPRYKDPFAFGFSLNRSDCIIMIMADVALFTTIVYYLTRNNLLMRLGSLGILMAAKLASTQPGWVHSFYSNFPIPFPNGFSFLGPNGLLIVQTIDKFFSLSTCNYLFITIFGTIIGDMILQWINHREESEELISWPRSRFAVLAVVLLGIDVLSLCLLKGRYVWELILALIPILLVVSKLTASPKTSIERLIHDAYKWGAMLLALGMLFEPYEGGIKKDPATMSYFMVSAGLAICTLLIFTILIEVFRKQNALQLLIDNGQNPMIAYTAGGNFICLIVAALGIDKLVTKYITVQHIGFLAPWVGFVYSLFLTLLVALTVSIFTRRKIFWRT